MPDVSLFQYDASAPLEFVVLAERVAGGAQMRDVTYASPRGGRVPAYLITPAQSAPQAGVIFGHWGEGSREEFVDEAVILAGLGFASLCLDAPFRRPQEHDLSLLEVAEGDLQWVVDVRRGVDLLMDRLKLPVGRLGYVGHSYAATLAGAVAGIEHRLTALVIMAGEPALSEWILLTTHPALVHERETTPPEDYQAYLAALAPLDASHYIGQAAPSSLFFQFAREDEYLPADRRDRAAFLCEKLGVASLSTDILNLLEQAPIPIPLEAWDASEPAT